MSNDKKTSETTNIRLKMMREVAIMADKYYDKASELGKIAAENMTRNHRSQITGLEAVANSALKVTDVFNFIKTQTARKKYWQQQHLGARLLETFNRDLRDDRQLICSKKEISIQADSRESQQLHLYLIREFVRQFAAQYEYQCMLNENKKGGHI